MRNSFSDCFKVLCPLRSGHDTPVQQIRTRGNLPLILQEDMVIEIKRSDLLESWRETCALSRVRVDILVKQAAYRIHDALEEVDLTDAPGLASDTAAFFLLALRHKGLKLLPSCTILYRDEQIEVANETQLIN